MTRPLALCLALLVSACGGRVADLRIVDRPLPAELLTCAPEPDKPKARPLMQSDVAAYLLRLRAAGEDCRGKLGEVRALEAGRRQE